MDTRINSKAEHKEVRRTVGPINGHGADFMGYKNGTNMSVQMVIKEHWVRFPFKFFEGDHNLSLGFKINNH